MTLLETMLLGSYVFTGGAYVWAWRLHRLLTNHLEGRVQELEVRERTRSNREEGRGEPL